MCTLLGTCALLTEAPSCPHASQRDDARSAAAAREEPCAPSIQVPPTCLERAKVTTSLTHLGIAQFATVLHAPTAGDLTARVDRLDQDNTARHRIEVIVISFLRSFAPPLGALRSPKPRPFGGARLLAPRWELRPVALPPERYFYPSLLLSFTMCPPFGRHCVRIPENPGVAHMPSTTHFHSNAFSEFSIFHHRPHKTFIHYFNALAATAMFRVWPIVLFMGGVSTMVVLVNKKTDVTLEFNPALLTALGVLLSVTLSYRTSSAYERYQEGRRMWTNIILSSRCWARTVWNHCPDTVVAEPPTDERERAKDIARAVIEKKTMVQLALAFAVAVKHYLRGEEGIYYEDLWPLVNFLPVFELPSGMPGACETTNMHANGPRPCSPQPPSPNQPPKLRKATHFDDMPFVPPLKPADMPPKMNLSKVFGLLQKKPWRSAMRQRERAIEDDMTFGGPASDFTSGNIPLEVTLFMSTWISTLQRRKTIDVPTTSTLFATVQQFNESLACLERILSTPIPWSYNAHIWEVSWIYCFALPFQCWAAGFGWVTIPAVIVTTYIIMGYLTIAEEIEDPFGYDANDLNLRFFCREIIAKELDAITSRPYTPPEEWIFTPSNRPFGLSQPSADHIVEEPIMKIRARLATVSGSGGPSRKSTMDVV